MSFLKPSHLKKGDSVSVVASCSPFEKESFLRGVAVLESLGLRVKFAKNIFTTDKQLPYLAGTDARRFSELKNALCDQDTKAIFFARGGYGAARLIPFLQKIKLPAKPKIIAGLSDVTSLHLYFQKRLRWMQFYAPVVGGNMGQLQSALAVDSLEKNLMSPEPVGKIKIPEMKVIQKGIATAPLVGGCLTLVVASLGTPYEINVDDKILFLEDVNEKPYQIDRQLTQLKLAGKLKKCRGVILGQLSGTDHPEQDYIKTIADVLHDVKGPVVMNFPTGHIQASHTLPLGVKITLDTKTKTVNFLESALK